MADAAQPVDSDQPVDSALRPDGELPAPLADTAAERLIAAGPLGRDHVVRELAAAHPAHAAALRRLADELAAADDLLAAGFRGAMPTVIGPYRVVSRLGAGAFGVVFLGAQERPIQRLVAIKVLRPGAGDRHTLARFELERQLLAQLNHPAIAHVLDAGALPDGRPFFVMEYVDGMPIRRYCDEQQLTVDARVRVFLDLCRGVEHAHRRGIVHRDLKPANVLIVAAEHGPLPKIIDFGIAKALHVQPAGADVHTETGRVVGTPGYMSPEQAAGQVAEVDARADVFALGVMLYELLTGELPWGRRPEQTDSEPLRPSARVVSDPSSTTELAQRRQSRPRQLAARLRGDLDCIVLKALAHDRADRYASAQEFAADLEHHLRGEAIAARPTRLGQRVRRLVRRHRMVLAGALACLALAVGTWSSVHFSARAEASAGAVDAAQQELAAAQGQVAQMSTEAEAAARSLLARANDKQLRALPESAPVRKLLVQDALAFYEKFLRERPADPSLREGRARALETLSRVHRLVGEYATAISVARESIAEATALLAADSGNCAYRGVLAHAHCSLARVLADAGQLAEARANFDSALPAYELCYAADPGRYAASFAGALVASCKFRNRDAEAAAQLAALRRAVAIAEAALLERPDAEVTQTLIDASGTLGRCLTMLGDVDGAQQAFERVEQLLGGAPQSPTTTCSLYYALAELASARGDAPAAIATAQKGITAAERWCELEPTRVAACEMLVRLLRVVADEHAALGEHAEAASASRRAIAATEARLARFPGDPSATGDLANVLANHAYILFVPGRRGVLGEAEDCARRSVATMAGASAGMDRRLRLRQQWKSRMWLGMVLDARGSAHASAHWDEVGAALDEYASEFEVTAADAFDFALALLRLCQHRLRAGRQADAGAALAQAEALVLAHRSVPDFDKRVAEAGQLAALLAVQRGDLAGAAAAVERVLADAAGWRGALAAADGMHATWRAAAAAHPSTATAPAHRDRAIELAANAIDALEAAAAAAPADLWLVVPLHQTRIKLAELLSDRGENERAHQLLAEALPALAAAREEAHANCWDDELFARGRALAAH